MARFASITEDRQFLAVIADVEGSREIDDRAAFQRRLETALGSLNGLIPRPRLPAKFRITAGDEVQGLLADPGDLVEVCTVLADKLDPVRLVCGAGWGPLTTDPGPDVARLDGPCFHKARHSVVEAARQGRWVRVEGFGDVQDEAVSAFFFLIGSIRDGWTVKQTKYARAARGRLQKDVAEQFGVSPSVISESLKSARFDAVLAGESAVRRLLHKFGEFAELGGHSGNLPK